ncbi:MAG: FAD-dependent oxidoreductase [Candidatus Eremiobacteraeota bacterium]|nr:FAD-dependent oxidoreductase [Candidatus Eremiobacteraeota bacterium]MBV9055978.1 FAD-dependent oxidoreductase [Candidatus Eremiobacteraeota bacterium]MBV9698634.1 FAD-dependent oxidoreductase [Candidatus Eremiobacteraeota bacterium]
MFPYALREGSIGTLLLRNRIIMGSMHLGVERDAATLAEFYAVRARGGVGLIVTGGSAVNRSGAGGVNYSLVNDDGWAPSLRAAAEAVHAAGGRIALQLFHAGRYALKESYGLQPVAPSAIPSRFSPDAPRALSDDEIRETIADFARGALRARELGYDAVEVMASEGYLLNQFLSPLTNRRDDAWGGDLDRRMNAARAVLRAIRDLAGSDFPVIFRISGADLMTGSTTQAETLQFARTLAADGVDALNVGIGWHESSIPTVQQVVPGGVWIPYAAAIKRAVTALPVIASNRINSIAAAEAALAEGSADFISMARPFLADAAIVAKATEGRSADVDTCIACNQACIDRSLIDAPVSCMVNPRAARELAFPEPDLASKNGARYAVVGGGPAGMEAARALAALGGRVVLFEADDELGGQFRMARKIPGKRDFGETIRYFSNELPRLGVEVRLNRRVAASDELREFDAVVLATGVLPRRALLAGDDLPHVVSYADLLLRDAAVGERIAVVGAGGIGVDVAHYLSFGEANADDTTRFLYEQGLAAPLDGELLVVGRKRVRLLRRGAPIGERIGKTTRWAILRSLRAAGVEMYPNIAYERIVPEGLVIRTADGALQTIFADTVVIAAGQERNDALLSAVAGLRRPYRIAGGARDASELNAVRAFDEGLRAAHELTREMGSAAHVRAKAH